MDKLIYLKEQKIRKSILSIEKKYKKIIEQWSLAKRKQRDIDRAYIKAQQWYNLQIKKEKTKSKWKTIAKKINYLNMYDTIYAIYTVLKRSYVSGLFIQNTCISCGASIEVWHLENKMFIRNPNCQNGHYISRSLSKDLVYYDDNTRCQCGYCNGTLHGNLAQYRLNLIHTIWEDNVEYIEDVRYKKFSLTTDYILPRDKYSVKRIDNIKLLRNKVLNRLYEMYGKTVSLDISKPMIKKIMSL